MKNFVSYLKNVRAELAHVVWPKRDTAIIHTGLIILLSVLTALIIVALDFTFRHIVSVFVGAA